MDVNLRAMREADAPDLFEMYNQPAFRFGTLALPFESFEAVKAWAAPRSPRDVHLVAEVDGRVVGAAALRPFYGRRAHAAEFWLAVNEDVAGRGIGAKLLAAIIDTADNWLNVTRIEMTVFVDNTRAIALYERFGFEIEGTHRAASFRNGAFVDVHCMARLGPGMGPRPALSSLRSTTSS
ncbi:GNAT family acetyltransferase [Methylobacterium tarhaniae]|uniref:GNAT family acetyltransferase n=1 Tax=Methylobacterium tarhaniae TaxID=1187852 RepID=A0A0J6TCG7_9HYPH|nr:GNAT family N-acetyltransferase [Methylobacterium tarhaniae]KMO43532.1 GNAT family acetyltransferase [Methylobacterium tarhaniae]